MTALTAPVRRPRGRRDERPRLEVVREPRRRHTLAFVLLYLVCAGLTVFGTVTLNAMAAGDAVRARALEQRVGDAERAYGQLVADVARLEDPGRVRQAALDLGMVPATSPRYLVLERSLPADGERQEAEIVAPGETTDPVKPVLSVER